MDELSGQSLEVQVAKERQSYSQEKSNSDEAKYLQYSF